MFRAFIGNPAYRLTWARRLALLFLTVYIAVFLAASIVIITNANHECIGDGCPICKLIHNAVILLNQIGKIDIAFSVFLFVLFLMFVVIMMKGLLCHRSSTLVQIKVKLNI